MNKLEDTKEKHAAMCTLAEETAAAVLVCQGNAEEAAEKARVAEQTYKDVSAQTDATLKECQGRQDAVETKLKAAEKAASVTTVEAAREAVRAGGGGVGGGRAKAFSSSPCRPPPRVSMFPRSGCAWAREDLLDLGGLTSPTSAGGGHTVLVVAVTQQANLLVQYAALK